MSLRGRAAVQGLTLVELLVGMAIVGIILGALVSFFMHSTQASSQSGNRADMQQEILTAQQLIAARLREAWAIFPPGSIVDFGSGQLRRNPAASNINGSWEVGAHPLLAMVLPPEVPGGSCDASVTEGCYRFFAYYPVKRSIWVAGTSADSTRNPGDDPNNADTWVLAEYSDVYPSADPPTLPQIPPIDGNEVNLLADYLAPTIVTPGLTTSGNTYQMFGYSPASGPVQSVTVRLAGIRLSRGQTLRLPGNQGTYTTTISPQNLGKVIAP